MIRKTLFVCLLAGSFLGAIIARGGPPFVVGDGIVVFEAEDFSTNRSPLNGHQWIYTNTTAGFSSNGYMEATPDNGLVFTNWTTNSPELRYAVSFPNAGTFALWVRGYAIDASSDSIHWGLDGQSNNSAGLSWTPQNAWAWTNRVAGTTGATISVGSAGTHTLSLWVREDAAKLDRVVLTSDTNFQPRIGNAWHIPASVSEAGVPIMRMPFASIFSNTAVKIYSGNQFQSGANGANQLGAGSAIFYRNATNATWTELGMTFQILSGNNKYYAGTIPANTFKAGDVVQYYLRIPYSDRLPTFLYVSNGVSLESELESVAKANPFSYTVLSTPPQGLPSPTDWRSVNIYQIFTDRFFDGDPSNNTADPEDYYQPGQALGIHGGDLKGIERKLDYIKALGANAIWLSPIPLTAGTNVAYHGYVARNFYQLAPHWGTEADLTSMVAAAHARGIYVILDVVVNHQSTIIDSGDAGFPNYSAAGYNMRWTVATNQYPPPFNSLAHFHNHGNIADYGNATQVQIGDLRALDDLKTETEYVRTNMVQIYRHWLDVADFDGFRLDASKHAEVEFWQHWNPEIRAYAAAKGKTNFFTYGENISGDAANGEYTGTKAGAAFANDSALDYPLYFSLNSVFATASGNTKQIEDHYNAIPTYYDPYAQDRLVTFLDNHDRTRFMSSGNANNNQPRLLNALSFLYSSRGVPCLYQGTEQAFNGGVSPNNREDVFDGQFEQGPSLGDNFNMTHAAFLHLARINNFRRLYPALTIGTHVNLWNSPSGPGLFAYARRSGSQEVMVILNTAGSQQTLTNRTTTYTAGTQLANLFNTSEVITVTGSQTTPPIVVPATGCKMFIATSQLLPLDPVVTNQTPAHGVTNVLPTTAIVLKFSKPMDTTSVQSAFSVTPAASGAFTWSASRDTVTFTPSGLGMAASTTVVVSVGTGAVDSINGRGLYAPFQTFLVTGPSSLTDSVPPALAFTLPASGAVLTGPVTVSGTATDNVAPLRVEFRLDSFDWVSAAGTSAWSVGFNSALFANGPHQLVARALDTSGNMSSEATVPVSFINIPGAYTQRIAAGSPNDVTNCDAAVWSADRAYAFGSFGYVGGTNGSSANAISDVCAQAWGLYQRERHSDNAGSFSYVFHCPPGIYETLLLNAETTATSANERVFVAYIGGDQILTNFDLFAAAGGINRPLVLGFTNVVADGLMEIQFVPQPDSARISGIQIRKIGEADSDGDGIPDWWMLAHYGHATGQDADESLGDQDGDEDAFNTLQEYLADTMPTNGLSYLQVKDITLQPTPTLVVNTSSNRLYELVAAPAPDDTNTWSVLQTSPGTGGDLSLTDTNSIEHRVYRIEAQLPQ